MAGNLHLRDGFRRSGLTRDVERGEVSERFLTPPPSTTPRIDVGRVDELSQSFAAPNIRRARSGLTRALTRAGSERNPAVRRLLSRGALEGFGSAISDVTAGARRSALETVRPEFSAEAQAERDRFQEQLRRERFAEELRLFEEERRFEEEEAAAPTHTTTFRRNLGPNFGLEPLGGFDSGSSAPGGPQATGRTLSPFEARGGRFERPGGVSPAQTASQTFAALQYTPTV